MKDIGLGIKSPIDTCKDPKCPFHGGLPVRGQVFDCTVVSDSMEKTVVVARNFEKKSVKYERFEKKESKIHAHNPSCLHAKNGDKVRIAECRPLSKTKSFVVVEILRNYDGSFIADDDEKSTVNRKIQENLTNKAGSSRESINGLSKIKRYTKVDFPDKCKKNEKINLSIQLLVEQEIGASTPIEIVFPKKERSIKLMVFVTAPGFDMNHICKPMDVPLNENSEKLTYNMCPRENGVHLAEIEIFYKATRIGYIICETKVSESRCMELDEVG